MATDLNHSQGETSGSVVTYTADERESLSDAVIAAMRLAAAAVRESDADDRSLEVGVIDPLFESIDPDALDALYSTTPDGSRTRGTVTFTHSGFEVIASASGEITVSHE